jgi:hypothetical protein
MSPVTIAEEVYTGAYFIIAYSSLYIHFIAPTYFKLQFLWETFLGLPSLRWAPLVCTCVAPWISIYLSICLSVYLLSVYIHTHSCPRSVDVHVSSIKQHITPA